MTASDQVVLEVTTTPTVRALAAVVGVLRLRAGDVDRITWTTRGGPGAESANLRISMTTSRLAHLCQALRRLVDVTDVQVVDTH